jgi:hypothetical protein
MSSAPATVSMPSVMPKTPDEASTVGKKVPLAPCVNDNPPPKVKLSPLPTDSAPSLV